MRFSKLRFGSITIDSVLYKHDVIIDRGKIAKRKKKPSKKFREEFGHTPISIEEKLPWKCRRLIIGTGNYGSLPVMDEVKDEARRRRVELIIAPTDEAVELLDKEADDTNAVLHVTC
jgi:hypothetical protein